MTKRIVLFSDGTGNSSAKAEKTNVWRLFRALDQDAADQLAMYDDGVGTSSNKYLALLGGAFGFGLKRNVLALYKFVCRNHESGDDIFGFGFSRGSFTIRVLIGLIANEGLVPFSVEEELDRNARAAYRHYRAARFPSWSPIVLLLRKFRDCAMWARDRIRGLPIYDEVAAQTKAQGRTDIPIRFLGLWDTVEAYGMPIVELKRGISWVLWPMLFGDFALSPLVQRACHALSLDDERTTFHPLLWDEVAEAELVRHQRVAAGRLSQVWFSGVHSNVGGGYPEDQLSLVPLDWMMAEAVAAGLRLASNSTVETAGAKSPYARLYDSRAGLMSYYRYAPRQIYVRKDAQGNRILPVIHGSVILRMAAGSDQYSPISLPHEFWVLAPDGQLLPMEGAPLSLKMDMTKRARLPTRPTTQAPGALAANNHELLTAIDRLSRPDRLTIRLVWDTVFWRQCVYIVTIALTLLLVSYPWVGRFSAGAVRSVVARIPLVGNHLSSLWGTLAAEFDQGSRGPISSVVDALGMFIPSYATSWVSAVKQTPLEIGIILGVLAACFVLTRLLRMRIHDRARLAWRKELLDDYCAWYAQSKKGWRNSIVLALLLAVLCFALTLASASYQVKPASIELGLVVLTLALMLAVRSLGQRPDKSPTTGVPGTAALKLARFLRNNRHLRTLYGAIFERTVPIVFALLLLAAGLMLANRLLFDLSDAAGLYCSAATNAPSWPSDQAGLNSRGFTTDKLCFDSGMDLKAGQRYRITLKTPGDWFDGLVRTDMLGFEADGPRHFLATPLKRFLLEQWFVPIARIGALGNDEYVLKPVNPSADPESPTAAERHAVTTDILARSDGRLFLYVNDAVLMLPGQSDRFYGNNSGGGTLSVEHLGAGANPLH